MNKVEAISKLEEIKEFYGDNSEDYYVQEFVALKKDEKEAIDMGIDALQFQDIMINNPKTAKPTPEVCKRCKDNKQDDWIPVSDDSIVPDYKVICQDEYENMMLGYVWVDDYGIWVCEDDNEMMDDVVAWRPLPAPYKENK